MSKVIVSSLIVVGCLLGAQLVFAAGENPSSEQKVEEAAAPLVEVGNKICPVSGEKVGEMGEVVKHTYNGKVYNLCCSMCAKDFGKDPEKFSKIAEDEVANEKVEDKTGS